MGDMHVVATYTGLEGLRRRHGPDEDRADARRVAVLRSGRDGGARRILPTSRRWLRHLPAAAAARAAVAPLRARRPGGPAAPPALTVTTEKLGDGVYRLTTGTGSYDSLIVEFKDHVMMLEAGQNEARALAYIAETKKLIPEQADPIRDEHASALRPHRRAAGAGGRRRDDHHAEEQRDVLRARRSTRRERC